MWQMHDWRRQHQADRFATCEMSEANSIVWIFTSGRSKINFLKLRKKKFRKCR